MGFRKFKGGLKALIVGDPIPIEDGWTYTMLCSPLWSYTNYRWYKKKGWLKRKNEKDKERVPPRIYRK